MKTSLTLFFIGLIGIVLLTIISPNIFTMVFGEEWSQAGTYFRLLSPLFIIQFSVYPLSQTLNILEKQEIQLVWNAARTILVFGGILLMGFNDISVYVFVFIYGLIMGVMYMVFWYLCYKNIVNLTFEKSLV